MGKRGKRALVGSIAVLAMAAAAWGGTVAFTGGASTSGTRAASGSGVGSEGIKVHGHWKLTVVNPDGSVARTTEFENSLTSLGADVLAHLLAREVSVEGWNIRLLGTPRIHCGDPASPCVIHEPPTGNLTLDTSTPGELTLAGDVTVATASSIDHVATDVFYQCTAVAPADCQSLGVGFTDKNTSNTTALPVDVQAGQVVQVSVTLSFS